MVGSLKEIRVKRDKMWLFLTKDESRNKNNEPIKMATATKKNRDHFLTPPNPPLKRGLKNKNPKNTIIPAASPKIAPRVPENNKLIANSQELMAKNHFLFPADSKNRYPAKKILKIKYVPKKAGLPIKEKTRSTRGNKSPRLKNF